MLYAFEILTFDTPLMFFSIFPTFQAVSMHERICLLLRFCLLPSSFYIQMLIFSTSVDSRTTY